MKISVKGKIEMIQLIQLPSVSDLYVTDVLMQCIDTWTDSSPQQHSEVHTSVPSGCKRLLGCSKGQEPNLEDLGKKIKP